MKTTSFLLALLLFGCGDDDTMSADAGHDTGVCGSDEACSDRVFCNGIERCDPDDFRADGRGCVAADEPCLPGQTCNEVAGECQTMCELSGDADGDGALAIACGGDDCDDSDPSRFPDNEEVCDGRGLDEDCDPTTIGERDADGDGAIDIRCCNADNCGTDCDDGRAGVFPGATETCNERDEDCDGVVDEDVPVRTYFPDCDRDGFGDDSVEGVVACSRPDDAPESCPSGDWSTAIGDCEDGMMSINPGNPEVCNAVDDDCDGLVDDVMDGTVVCFSGETAATCTNACGVVGTGSCAPDCLSFDCSSSDFETCNYCDDDGDGNLFGEKPLATRDVVADFNCGAAGGTAPTFGDARCVTTDGPRGSFLMEAVLLDGSANDRAGALWLQPSDWYVGWGTVEVEVVLKVRAVPTGTGAEVPLGGWSIVLANGGTVGVGPATNLGIPTTVDGISTNWYWSSTDTCFAPNRPPYNEDVIRTRRQGPSAFAIRSHRTEPIETTWACSEGDGLDGGSTGFDGQTTFIEQRLRLRYEPDDPTTASINEERIDVFAQSPNGSGPASNYAHTGDDGWDERPMDELPPGSGPLRVGLTAGTYTQSGFDGPPADLVFGVPVEARVELWVFTPPTGPGEEPTFTNQEASVTLDRLCPLPD